MVTINAASPRYPIRTGAARTRKWKFMRFATIAGKHEGFTTCALESSDMQNVEKSRWQGRNGHSHEAGCRAQNAHGTIPLEGLCEMGKPAGGSPLSRLQALLDCRQERLHYFPPRWFAQASRKKPTQF